MSNYDSSRSYIEHFEVEHRRLGDLIRKTTAMFPSWEEVDLKDWLPRIVERLKVVRTELERHFQEERAGGCLEEAVSHCPSIAHEARQAEAEHPKLLQLLDDLIRVGEGAARPTLKVARALQRGFQGFVKQLQQHEALEFKIVQHGFNVCLDEGDHDPLASSAGPPPSAHSTPPGG